MKNLLLILFLIFSSGLVITSYDAYGHGVGSEIFPPVELNGKLVSVEVTSSTKNDLTNDDQQISISLIQSSYIVSEIVSIFLNLLQIVL